MIVDRHLDWPEEFTMEGYATRHGKLCLACKCIYVYTVCICVYMYIYILYVLIYLLEGHQQRNYGWKNLGLNSGSTEVEGCYNREYWPFQMVLAQLTLFSIAWSPQAVATTFASAVSKVTKDVPVTVPQQQFFHSQGWQPKFRVCTESTEIHIDVIIELGYTSLEAVEKTFFS